MSSYKSNLLKVLVLFPILFTSGCIGMNLKDETPTDSDEGNKMNQSMIVTSSTNTISKQLDNE